jgi:diguanylate cyclase (GGDEF)-like protein
LLDPETGLYNTRGLSRRAREVSAEAVRRHAALACVVFAAAPERQDSVAAPGGEALARSVGGLLRQHGRASDVIGRLGDGEYAVIAPHTEARGVVQMVERLERLLQDAEASGANRIHLRAGYSATPDLSASNLDANQVLGQATSALRSLLAEASGPSGTRLRSFEEVPPSAGS